MSALKSLVYERRQQIQQRSYPESGVIDSQSVRWGVTDSEKGFDGFKKVKGIKRHLIVDSNGYPLCVEVSKANIHDSKGAYGLVRRSAELYESLNLIKADKAYSGNLQSFALSEFNISVQCVKSNFGTSSFIPIDGRWVVERTFSWLDSYRRLCRNYEKLLATAKHVVEVCSVMFMLRYFR